MDSTWSLTLHLDHLPFLTVLALSQRSACACKLDHAYVHTIFNCIRFVSEVRFSVTPLWLDWTVK